MKTYIFILVALIVVLVAWRLLSVRHSVEPNIDVMMDQHAGDAVEEAKSKYGVVLDYSPESVEQVDAILGKLHAQHKKKPFDARTLGRQARLWGSYLGAVIKRIRPAKWQIDSEAAGKGSLPLVLEDRDQTFPCTWTYKRITNGDEDNVAVKFQLAIIERDKLRGRVGIPPKGKEK